MGTLCGEVKVLRGELEKLKALELVRLPGQEPSKLVISTRKTRMTGRQLQELLLERYHLELEMAAGSYALAMTSREIPGREWSGLPVH